MRDRKHVSTYHMTYETFMYSVRELEPFVTFRATMFVRAPFKLRKDIGLVLYQLAYGVSANIMLIESMLELLQCVSMLILLSMP